MAAVKSVPLIGREGEIAALDDALAERETGHAPVVVVHGEAGIGKTALVVRFAEQAAEVSVGLDERGASAALQAGFHLATKSLESGEAEGRLDRLIVVSNDG